jgi:hypothetical protein
MTTSFPADQPKRPRAFRLFISISGIFLTLGTAILAGRLIWEMTWLTWNRGPQMIGFSLAHGFGALLFVVPLLLAAWLVVCLCAMLVWAFKRRRIPRQVWLPFAAAILVMSLLVLPQGFWNRLFAAELVKSPKAADLYVEAAGEGELGTLKVMLGHGLPIEATDQDGNTALGVAAARGQRTVVDFLVHSGANVNAVNLYGDSPLEIAREARQDDIARLLEAAGAKDVRGDAAQRERATDLIVRRGIEELKRSER